jgi:hypothetical protein
MMLIRALLYVSHQDSKQLENRFGQRRGLKRILEDFLEYEKDGGALSW